MVTKLVNHHLICFDCVLIWIWERDIATEEEVKERASYWDQTASDYVDLAERYLGFQQPGSVYGLSDAGDGCKRVCSIDFFEYFFRLLPKLLVQVLIGTLSIQFLDSLISSIDSSI